MDRRTCARPGGWTNRFGGAIDDVRAAIGWALSADGDADLGATLILAALPLGYYLSRLDEFCGYAARALAMADDGAVTLDATLMARLRVALGTLIYHTRGLEAGAEDAYERALAATAALPQTGPHIQALTGIAMLALARGDYAGGRRHGAAMRALAARDADPLAQVWADHTLALAHHYLGDHRTARELASRVSHDPSPLVHPVDNLTGAGGSARPASGARAHAMAGRQRRQRRDGRPVRRPGARRHAAFAGPGAGICRVPDRAVARRRSCAARLRRAPARTFGAPCAGGMARLERICSTPRCACATRTAPWPRRRSRVSNCSPASRIPAASRPTSTPRSVRRS
jgi:hypothetical protein